MQLRAISSCYLNYYQQILLCSDAQYYLGQVLRFRIICQLKIYQQVAWGTWPKRLGFYKIGFCSIKFHIRSHRNVTVQDLLASVLLYLHQWFFNTCLVFELKNSLLKINPCLSLFESGNISRVLEGIYRLFVEGEKMLSLLYLSGILM